MNITTVAGWLARSRSSAIVPVAPATGSVKEGAAWPGATAAGREKGARRTREARMAGDGFMIPPVSIRSPSGSNTAGRSGIPRRRCLSGGRREPPGEPGFALLRMEAEGTGLSLVGHPSALVDDVDPLRPPGVERIGAVVHRVDGERDAVPEPRHEVARDRDALS